MKSRNKNLKLLKKKLKKSYPNRVKVCKRDWLKEERKWLKKCHI
jgi:hypothetical protein